MKRRHLTLAAVLLIGAGFAAWRLLPAAPPAPPPQVRRVPTGPAPNVTNVDPATVFQRAFWKRPTEADQILHAERREWQDAGNVSHWQWFLEVEPSPALLSYLRDDNAFRLSTKKPVKIPADAPAWFIRDLQGTQAMVARQGGMQLIFTAGGAKLYAMDSGGGFQPGAPEKSQPFAQDTSPPSPPPAPASAKR
ncbi:hypothetical protein [Haloferula sp. BvORR071]|uniref:hypothetical protein n=1 Tax=Haloferula sp. BvORR071 TaxID=1396141 RepID=UPI00054F3B2F|nr:hypothetical protein [Haloferula sp. BvORR071]